PCAVPCAPAASADQGGERGVEVGRLGLVVGEFGEDPGHAARVGDGGEDQAAGDARGQPPCSGQASTGEQARQDEGACGEADLRFDRPGGAGAGGAVDVVAELRPGGGAAGQVGGGDAVLGQALPGLGRACTGGAHDEEAAAVGGGLQGGQGHVEVVQRDV